MNNKLYRVSDEGMVSGVCAGIARFLGVSVNIVRVIAVLFLFMGFFVVTTVIYFVLVFVLDDVPGKEAGLQGKKPFKNRIQESKTQVNLQQSRLNRLEKYITSSHYELEKKFKDLK